MSYEEQSRYFAVIFLPWSLKPLFAYCMDHYPPLGYHRKTYVGFSCLSFLLYQSSCALNLVLVDIIGEKRGKTENKDTDTSPQQQQLAQIAQSETSAARMFGSVISFLIGLLFYGCGGSSTISLTSRQIIGLTAIIPIFGAIAACFLPEKSDLKTMNENSSSDSITDSSLSSSHLKGNCSLLFGIFLFQCLYIWIGIQNLLPNIPWVVILVLLSLLILSISFLAYVRSRLSWTPVASAALLFLLNAIAHTKFGEIHCSGGLIWLKDTTYNALQK